jgi:BetI-type transcriptional repressor, C-terminal
MATPPAPSEHVRDGRAEVVAVYAVHCILAHYFDDKADILGAALMLSHRRVAARMDARAAGRTGLDALHAVMVEALPLREGVDIDLAAHQLLVLIDGLCAQRVLYPGRVTAARQRQMLGALLDSFRPWPGKLTGR